MNIRFIAATAFSAATLLAMGASQAAMSPHLAAQTPQTVHRVDCEAGFHIGPLGTCIIGVDEPRHERVIERRATDEGCETKTVKKTDGMGDSVTHTKTNCE